MIIIQSDTKITIRTNGCGYPEKKKKKLFNVLMQVHVGMTSFHKEHFSSLNSILTSFFKKEKKTKKADRVKEQSFMK